MLKLKIESFSYLGHFYSSGRKKVITCWNFLEKNEIPFEEINIIENPQYKDTVESLNNGRQTVPTIIIENRSEKIILSEPTDIELSISIKKLSC